MKPSILLLFLFAAVAFGATDSPPVDANEEGFNLFLFGFLVVGICIVLFLFAVSIVLGIIAAVATTILVALGIISLSAFVGLLHRRFSSGFRALHYQVCAVAAMPAAIGALWLGSYIFTLHFQPRDILIVGSIAGLCSGLLLAFAFDRLVRIAYRRFATPSLPNATGNG
jgi:hypothetical protein